MTLPEQAGKVAGNVVDAMKLQPALLALILLVGVVFAATYFAIQNQQQRHHEQFSALLDRCVPTGTGPR